MYRVAEVRVRFHEPIEPLLLRGGGGQPLRAAGRLHAERHLRRVGVEPPGERAPQRARTDPVVEERPEIVRESRHDGDWQAVGAAETATVT